MQIFHIRCLAEIYTCMLFSMDESKLSITLEPVAAHNWRAVSKLEVSPEQREFVADPNFYLALCAYDPPLWNPLAILADGVVVGFLMWAIDSGDGSAWLGGIMVDRQHQGRGYGGRAVQAAITLLARDHQVLHFALSYHPKNLVALRLYSRLGFVETFELEGDEIVARFRPERGT
jgi:diamine N-acetyltransferase